MPFLPFVYLFLPCERLRADQSTTQRSAALHEQIPGFDKAYTAELSAYFVESWGNRTRVDYGSGMELNFLCWLCVHFLSLPLRRC